MGTRKRFDIYRQNFIGFGFFYKRDFYSLEISLMLPFFAIYTGWGRKYE